MSFQYVESNRVSKAQKRREAKAIKKAEQIKRIEEAEKLDEHKERTIESDKLSIQLKSKKLAIKDIESDGDCLYRAIEHQLSISRNSSEKLNYQELRDKTSKYMLEHPDKFMPFLTSGSNSGPMTLKEYSTYCNKISTTKTWGGNVELSALTQIINRPIHVYQAEGLSPIILTPDIPIPGDPIKLSFHRHLYHLGEHYNSLVDVL